MRRLRGQQGGFTLVELTVASSILVAILALITSLLVTLVRLSGTSNAERLTQQNARTALETVFRQTRLASGFYSAGSVDPCSTPNGFVPGSAASNMFVRNSRGEVLEYSLSVIAGKAHLIETNFGACAAGGAGYPNGPGGQGVIVSKLTGDDVEVCGLSFIRDGKFPTGSANQVYPPSLVTIQLDVKAPSCVAAAGSGVSELKLEESVSLRGEFANFFVGGS